MPPTKKSPPKVFAWVCRSCKTIIHCGRGRCPGCGEWGEIAEVHNHE